MEVGTSSRGSRYTLAQVKTATDGYSKLLGRGEYGDVYYGKLTSGKEVAVKVHVKGSIQGAAEFMNEVGAEEFMNECFFQSLIDLDRGFDGCGLLCRLSY